MDAVVVQLTKGKQALIDAADLPLLGGYRWQAHWDNSSRFYAVRTSKINGKKKTVKMHRLILGLKPGDGRQVDHINRDTLDNRRCNLRVTDTRGNSENRRDQSPYGAGVRKTLGRYHACARWDGQRYCLGTYDTLAEATEARKKFLRERRNARAVLAGEGEGPA